MRTVTNDPSDRQSKNAPPVREDADEKAADAAYVGEQVRAAMRKKGWVDDEGKPDVRRLAEAVGARWQTAQQWVLGEVVPSRRYAAKLAAVFGMTLEDLIGIARGAEPRNPAWRGFLQTPEGIGMSERERHLVARIIPDGEPTISTYVLGLAAVRSAKK